MLTVEKLITIASGYDIAVAITNDPSHTPIMLLNGSIFNYHQFDPVYLPKLQKFLGDKFCYIQYDYVGYGQSSDLDTEFDFLTIAEQHVEVMDTLNIQKAHLFGVSKGSIIAQLVAARYPDRVISLGAYGSPNLAEDESRDASVDDFSQRLQSVQSLSGIYDDPITEDNYDLVYDTVYVPSIFGKELIELGFFEKLRNIWIKRKIKPMLLGPKIEMLDKLFRYYKEDITDEEKERYVEAMKSLTVPTFLIHGTADTTVPVSSSKKLSEWIPNSQLYLIDGYRHSNPMIIPWQGKKVMKIYAKFVNNIEEQEYEE